MLSSQWYVKQDVYESEADTIGGLAFEHVGGIPEFGDEVTVGRFLIRIVTVSGRRITKVEVTLLPPEEDEDDEEIMPSCLEWEEEDVEDYFEDIDCKISFEYDYSSDVEEGFVVSQTLEEGEEITEDTESNQEDSVDDTDNEVENNDKEDNVQSGLLKQLSKTPVILLVIIIFASIITCAILIINISKSKKIKGE